jgi:putative ABC transport system ATP-binding protein
MNDPLISLSNIVKRYQIGSIEHTVLKKLSFCIYSGELVAIVGPSGSGKSTLMNIIGLLDKAECGEYCLQQRNVNEMHDDQLAVIRNEKIGFVFQQFHLLGRLNAWQNVTLPLTYRKIKAQSLKSMALEALDKVGMASFACHKPTQLSGGQQQRVAIARALVGSPNIILADEPTGALDSATGQEIMTLLLQLHAQGKTIILITHDEQIAQKCSRKISLADGVMVSDVSK